MEGRAAVLGQADFVMPFAAMGLEAYTVTDDRQQIIASAKKAAAGGYALIILAEDVAAHALEVLDPLAGGATPCVVVVPFTTESTGLATRALADVLKVATGINIVGQARLTTNQDSRKV
ncbi:MAG: V-type ATP synthase subunit F [Sedimentisphaerales bacterium]|nr:V-type ATP synthase subunit F [Sedimentisphaerales bacterium]